MTKAAAKKYQHFLIEDNPGGKYKNCQWQQKEKAKQKIKSKENTKQINSWRDK